MINKFLDGLSKKSIYFGIAGLIGALIGGLIGEIPFLVTKQAGIELSENILETQKRVQEAGGKAGDVQVSLMWNNRNDLDLHVIDPSGEEIFFSHKRSVSAGELDVDRNVSGETITPVENVVWVNAPPEGIYKIYVKFYRKHDDISNTPFTVVINNAGLVKEFGGNISQVHAKNFVHEFSYSQRKARENMSSAFIVGLWGVFISLGIALLLVLSQRKLLKKSLFSLKDVAFASVGGAAAGLIAGILANYLFILALPRSLAWVVMGLFLGFALTKIIPNLKIKAGIIGGGIGGLLGGVLFTLLATAFDEFLGRIIGAMMIGFFIGLMISLLEEILREAWLIVEWNAKEKTHISLGETPIVIGSSSDAHIYLSDFPSIVATIRLEKGEIKFEDKTKNKTSVLKNDSKIQLGGINITVKAK